MAIIPKSPLERLIYFQEEVDKLFRLLFDSSPMSMNIESDSYPPVDMYEKDDHINYEFELPGLEKDDLNVSISNNLIVVEGIKKEHTKKGIKNYICMERVYGKFQRIVKMPSIVDTRKAKACYKDGLLTVSFPRINERRSKSTRVKID